MRKTAQIPTPDVIARDLALVELMSALAGVALLSSVAHLAFMRQTSSARRTETVDALSRAPQAHERWRAAKAQHPSLVSLGIPSTTANGYLSLSSSAASGLVATHSRTLTTAGAGGKNCTHETRVIHQF